MEIEYRNQKVLSCDELYKLFHAVSWEKDENTTQKHRNESCLAQDVFADIRDITSKV